MYFYPWHLKLIWRQLGIIKYNDQSFFIWLFFVSYIKCLKNKNVGFHGVLFDNESGILAFHSVIPSVYLTCSIEGMPRKTSRWQSYWYHSRLYINYMNTFFCLILVQAKRVGCPCGVADKLRGKRSGLY